MAVLVFLQKLLTKGYDDDESTSWDERIEADKLSVLPSRPEKLKSHRIVNPLIKILQRSSGNLYRRDLVYQSVNIHRRFEVVSLLEISVILMCWTPNVYYSSLQRYLNENVDHENNRTKFKCNIKFILIMVSYSCIVSMYLNLMRLLSFENISLNAKSGIVLKN